MYISSTVPVRGSRRKSLIYNFQTNFPWQLALVTVLYLKLFLSIKQLHVVALAAGT